MAERRIYTSSNGDTWDLVRTGLGLRVRHQPNAASGGGITDYDLPVFLSRDAHTPQGAELSKLIDSLIDGPGAAN